MTRAAVAMTTARPYPDEPAMATVYIDLPDHDRTETQWATHLTAQLDGVEIEVVIEPEGRRAGIILTAIGSSEPAALERAVDHLVSDPHSFGLVDAARTQRLTD